MFSDWFIAGTYGAAWIMTVPLLLAAIPVAVLDVVRVFRKKQ